MLLVHVDDVLLLLYVLVLVFLFDNLGRLVVHEVHDVHGVHDVEVPIFLHKLGI